MTNKTPTVAAAYRRWSKSYYDKAAFERGATDIRSLDPDRERDQWEAVRDALGAYCDPENRERFPPEMAFAIAQALDWILAGIEHPTWALIQKSRPLKNRLAPQQQKARASAVRYVRAAKEGLIAEEHPTKKIALWFKVRQRSVERWVEKWKDAADGDASVGSYLRNAPQMERLKALIFDAQKAGHMWQAFKDKPRADWYAPPRRRAAAPRQFAPLDLDAIDATVRRSTKPRRATLPRGRKSGEHRGAS